jgi:hypothetical protein
MPKPSMAIVQPAITAVRITARVGEDMTLSN